MNERIDQFCKNLRVKLSNIDNNMQALKAKIDSKAQTTEQEIRTHLDAVKKRVDQERPKVAAAQADIKKWVEERKATTNQKIAEWKAKSEKARLKSWADFADEAEQASLEAWLARKDAESAQGTKAA
jgi:hypothetical protein